MVGQSRAPFHRHPVALRLCWLALAALASLQACGPAPKPASAPPATASAAAPSAPAAPAAPASVPMAAPAAPAAPASPASSVVQRFTANGASPAWHAEVDGDVMTFEVPPVAGAEGSPRRVAVERLAYAHGANFSGRDGNVDVVLDINGTACRKTGAEREFTATLHYGSHTFHGCADAAR